MVFKKIRIPLIYKRIGNYLGALLLAACCLLGSFLMFLTSDSELSQIDKHSGKVIEKGDLREVFLHPQKQLTRQFVGGALQAQHILNTYNFDKLADNAELYQLVYSINDVTKSVVADLDVSLNTSTLVIFGGPASRVTFSAFVSPVTPFLTATAFTSKNFVPDCIIDSTGTSTENLYQVLSSLSLSLNV